MPTIVKAARRRRRGKHNHKWHRLAMHARNPLRLDPTRTTMIRRKFMADVTRRFKKLMRAVKDFLVTKDALGLAPKKNPFLGVLVQEREFQFRTDADKLKAFQDWLREQTDANVLSPPPGTPLGQPWTATYIESAYRQGLINAFIATRALDLGLDGANGRLDDFLRSAFGAPERLSKIQLLATRSFEDLKGVSEQMASKMRRILAQGMADGRGAADIAREMAREVESLTQTRALTIARTEIINAHSEGQLDSYEELGVQELGVDVEWSTAGDDRVCPLCEAMEGKVFKVEDARGIIPLHPNCRCAWIPHFEETKKK